jgi:hypothetical protein
MTDTEKLEIATKALARISFPTLAGKDDKANGKINWSDAEIAKKYGTRLFLQAEAKSALDKIGGLPSVGSHEEVIECPECNTEQIATVEHTIPWYSYVHECRECEHIIMESEWNKKS